MTISRRDVLKTSLCISTALPSYKLLASERVVKGSDAEQWPIGCFNRVWTKWTYDEALDGMVEAGFPLTGLLSQHKEEPFTMPHATNGYLDTLKKRISDRGLSVVVTRLKVQHDLSLDKSIDYSRKQIDHAKRLDLHFLLVVGAEKQEQYSHYCKVMSDAAEYAQQLGMQVVLKPHGGFSETAAGILDFITTVDHPNLRVWYDAGNIIHYTGNDPLSEMRKVAHLLTGFCAKDCAKKDGDVMLQFGQGQVDFNRIFGELKKADFQGPVFVECCAGKTLDTIVANMRENRVFLENSFAIL